MSSRKTMVRTPTFSLCLAAANRLAGITTTQLYTWNPILGSNGADCSTEFQAGVGYCVAVSS